MAEARYALIETATSLVVNIIVIDDDFDYVPPNGTFVVKVDETAAHNEMPMSAGTYNSSTKKFVQPSCFPLTYPDP